MLILNAYKIQTFYSLVIPVYFYWLIHFFFFLESFLYSDVFALCSYVLNTEQNNSNRVHLSFKRIWLNMTHCGFCRFLWVFWWLHAVLSFLFGVSKGFAGILNACTLAGSCHGIWCRRATYQRCHEEHCSCPAQHRDSALWQNPHHTALHLPQEKG